MSDPCASGRARKRLMGSWKSKKSLGSFPGCLCKINTQTPLYYSRIEPIALQQDGHCITVGWSSLYYSRIVLILVQQASPHCSTVGQSLLYYSRIVILQYDSCHCSTVGQSSLQYCQIVLIVLQQDGPHYFTVAQSSLQYSQIVIVKCRMVLIVLQYVNYGKKCCIALPAHPFIHPTILSLTLTDSHLAVMGIHTLITSSDLHADIEI